jgi:TPP-dependent pyruvate/acetoin dehydrogenase alpha subunit
MSVKAKSTRTSVSKPRNLRRGGAEAGILAGEAAGTGGPSLVEIAIWNELGTKSAPPRPFIQSTTDEQQRKWRDMVRRLNRLVLAGKMTNTEASELLGQEMQADIQQKIVDLRDPPNAQATIDKKGSDNPLIDTGAMKDNVKYLGLS